MRETGPRLQIASVWAETQEAGPPFFSAYEPILQETDPPFLKSMIKKRRKPIHRLQ